MDTKTICLAVLSQGDTTGYEIKKAFEDGPFSYFQEVSFGAIYPALNKALDEGLVSVTETAQQGRPPKKVYSITAAGLDALQAALAGPTPPDRVTSDFLFKLLFADLMDKGDVDRLIDTRLDEINAKIECMEAEQNDDAASMQPAETFVCGFGLAIYRAMRDHLAAHRDTLTQALRQDDAAGKAAAAD